MDNTLGTADNVAKVYTAPIDDDGDGGGVVRPYAPETTGPVVLANGGKISAENEVICLNGYRESRLWGYTS
jgi:hypothetical protein